MTKNNLSKEFEKELSKLKDNNISSAEYRKKKLITYSIRTIIATILYLIFWKHQWVRWSLIFYAPINLISFLSIFGWNFLINRKIEKTKRTIENLEQSKESTTK